MEAPPYVTMIPMTKTMGSDYFEPRLLKFGKSMSRLIGRSDNKEEVDGEFVEKFDNCIFNFLYVSRKQAMLKFTNGRFFVVNLSASNVTQLNGARLATSDPVQIHNGDILKIEHRKGALIAGIHVHYPTYSSEVPDSIEQENMAMQEYTEDTQTMEELIAHFKMIPNRSVAEECKLRGLLDAQAKMAEEGMTTKEALTMVPSLWKY